MSLCVRREVVVSRWERLRAQFPQPPASPSKTTGVKRKPSRWHRLTVSWNVRLGFSYSARFWVEVVIGPWFHIGARRQEVTTKSQASGIMSFPKGIQTSAGRSSAGDRAGWKARERRGFGEGRKGPGSALGGGGGLVVVWRWQWGPFGAAGFVDGVCLSRLFPSVHDVKPPQSECPGAGCKEHFCVSAVGLVVVVGTPVVVVSAAVEICTSKPPQCGLPWRLRLSGWRMWSRSCGREGLWGPGVRFLVQETRGCRARNACFQASQWSLWRAGTDGVWSSISTCTPTTHEDSMLDQNSDKASTPGGGGPDCA